MFFGLRLISGRGLLNISFEKMKLRCSFSSQKCVFAFGFSLLALLSLGMSAQAQDRLVLKDGKTQDVKILNASGSTVHIQVGGGSIGIPLSTVASVTMAPPPEFAPALAAYEAGQFAKALPLVKGLAEKYKGLPVDWARQLASMVGDIHVSMGNLKEAEAAYKEYQKLYPGAGSVQTDVGMARIAVARKDYDEARQKLEPIAEAALKEKTPPAGLGPAYSQTFFLLGQIAEARHQPAIALEQYLLTVTVYAADHTAVAAAQERANALRKQDPSLTAP